MLSRLIDLRDHFRQLHSLHVCNFFQVIPERIFETHARLVSINHDRAFDDRGFHDCPQKFFISIFLMILSDDVGRKLPCEKNFIRDGIQS